MFGTGCTAGAGLECWAGFVPVIKTCSRGLELHNWQAGVAS
jgi:hypothetical protein